MKKLTVKLLALALLVASVFSLASCSLFAPKPETDLKDAEKALEDNKYTVSHVDDEDELSAGVAEYLSASNDDDYLRVTIYKDSTLASIAYEELQQNLKEEKAAIKRNIKKYKHLIKKYKDDLKDDDLLDSYEDRLEDYEEQLEEMKNAVIGKSGKTVWAGTKDAIKDSKDK
jgi:hypothetical protein